MKFFKQRKTKKLLQELALAYDLLLEDRAAYRLNNLDIPELQTAVLSKFNLELLKTATYFDELRDSYIDFRYLNSSDDFWKLKKPITSEGTFFTVSGYAQTLISGTSFTTNGIVDTEYTSYVDDINNSSVATWLKKALKSKASAKLIHQANAICADYNIQPPSPQVATAASKFLTESTSGYFTYVQPTIFTPDFLITLAKHSHTNIILE